MTSITNPLELLMPPEWIKYFEITKIQKGTIGWRITLIEKEDLIPADLQGKEAVQNGYMNPVELNDFPLRGLPTYLRFIRRRWKEPGKEKSYFNNYNFHPEGMKATREFGAFLKEFD